MPKPDCRCERCGCDGPVYRADDSPFEECEVEEQIKYYGEGANTAELIIFLFILVIALVVIFAR
jgi:hypothetical protein